MFQTIKVSLSKAVGYGGHGTLGSRVKIFQGKVRVKERGYQGFLHKLVPQGMAELWTDKVGELHQGRYPCHILKA